MGKALVVVRARELRLVLGQARDRGRPGVLVVSATGRRINGYRFEPARIVSGTPRPLSGSERRSALASWHGLRGCTGLRR